jgi:hypothetical protein
MPQAIQVNAGLSYVDVYAPPSGMAKEMTIRDASGCANLLKQ